MNADIKLDPEYYFSNLEDFQFPEIFKVKHIYEILIKKNEIFDEFEPKIKYFDPTDFYYNHQITIENNVYFDEKVSIGKGTIVKKNSIIEGPVYIGKNCKIGPGAHIRNGVIIDDNVEIGKTEIKGSIILSGTKSHHHGYIGDSIIGRNVNIGSGFSTANFKKDGKDIKIGDYKTRKFGAVIGDNSFIGCNTVTAPGTLIGKNVQIYPLCFVRGFVSGNKIVKNKSEYEIVDIIL